MSKSFYGSYTMTNFNILGQITKYFARKYYPTPYKARTRCFLPTRWVFNHVLKILGKIFLHWYYYMHEITRQFGATDPYIYCGIHFDIIANISGHRKSITLLPDNRIALTPHRNHRISLTYTTGNNGLQPVHSIFGWRIQLTGRHIMLEYSRFCVL